MGYMYRQTGNQGVWKKIGMERIHADVIAVGAYFSSNVLMVSRVRRTT
jgi:hypothetical protein